MEKLSSCVFLEDEVFCVSEFVEQLKGIPSSSLFFWGGGILSFKIKCVSKMSFVFPSPLK